MVTIVPFDWPRFLRNAAPSPLFAEVAAAITTPGLPAIASADASSPPMPKLGEDALLHQVATSYCRTVFLVITLSHHTMSIEHGQVGQSAPDVANRTVHECGA